MAQKVSLIITVQNDPYESTKQRTITNVSASATDQQLYDFCVGYMNLTQDYAKSYAKVVRTDLEATNNG